MPDLPSNAIASYHDDGYYVARRLVDSRHIEAFLQDLTLVVKAQLERHRLPSCGASDIDSVHANLRELHHYNQALYLATLRLFNKLKSLYDVFLSNAIAETCHELGIALPFLHTLPLFHIMSHSLRIEEGYHGFDAHQDWNGLQSSLNAISVWLPLHDIGRSRFPLEVLPGSHKQGLWFGTLNDQLPFTPLEVGEGDVVFMSCFTIHRSRPTETDQLRIAASWRYEDALEDTFVDRHYPFAEARVLTQGLIVPDFPSPAQMQEHLKR